jgi:hypothetical protein
MNRAGTSERASKFAELPLYIDPLHFPNHGKNSVEGEETEWAKFCAKECDPSHHKVTSIVNNEVCEQASADSFIRTHLFFTVFK